MGSTSATNGSDCYEELTRAELITLRNSSQLSIDCHYVITDYNRGNVGSAIIQLHAVNENTLSSSAKVDTTFDNLSWEGRYDIDTNRIYQLNDNVGNVVTGENTVDAFPWGAANVYENKVFESTINYTAGQFYDNDITSSTVTIDAGIFVRNTIDNLSVVSVTNGSNFYDNGVHERARVTITSGSNLENKFGSSSQYTQAGTGYIRYSELATESTVTNGNTNITRTSFVNGSSVNTTGSSGSISYSSFDRGIASALLSIPNLVIQESQVHGGSTVSATGAARLRMYRTTGDSGGRFLVSAGATLVSDYSKIHSYGYVTVTGGTLNLTYSEASTLGYFRNEGGVNSFNRSKVTTQANMRFLGANTGGRIYYSTAADGAGMYQSNSTNCYMYYCTADSIGQMYINNRTNARFYYNHVDSYSYIRSYGSGSGQSIMYYCSASSRGYVDHINIGARIRYYAVRAEAQSIARQTGGTANANLYYSTFHAYYYALLVLTGGTRSGLHGYGRQNFNGMPGSNGTGQRNWT